VKRIASSAAGGWRQSADARTAWKYVYSAILVNACTAICQAEALGGMAVPTQPSQLWYSTTTWKFAAVPDLHTVAVLACPWVREPNCFRLMQSLQLQMCAVTPRLLASSRSERRQQGSSTTI
jgi:hypothetical protein